MRMLYRISVENYWVCITDDKKYNAWSFNEVSGYTEDRIIALAKSCCLGEINTLPTLNGEKLALQCCNNEWDHCLFWHESKEIKQAPVGTHKCTCSSHQIFNYGCTCGGC